MTNSRSMKNAFEDFEFYSSTFDLDTGTLVRVVEELPREDRYTRADLYDALCAYKGFHRYARSAEEKTQLDALKERWEAEIGSSFHSRRAPFSPVPETIDIKVTDWCNFGCSYCLSPETPVLMASGRWIPITDLQENDELWGFDEHKNSKSRQRRLVRTKVLHKWETLQPEILLTLEDGTILRTSPNHLWLVDRAGWLPTYRLGVGMSVRQIPKWESPDFIEDSEYQKGYLCGVSLGDGTQNFDTTRQIFWRVAVKDEDILERTLQYVTNFGVRCPGIRLFSERTETRAEVKKVEVRNREGLATLRNIVTTVDGNRMRALLNSGNFLRGFVAGCYDAEGSFNRSNLRIHQLSHPWMIDLFKELNAFGFSFEEEKKKDSGLRTVRLAGSYWKRLRFLDWCRPACSRKTLKEGALRSNKARIVSIQKTGRSVPMVDITTTSRTFFANGVATHNCYMDSTKAGKHASQDLLRQVFAGLKEAPYQIAFGGGEPVAHPDFPWFLSFTREHGTVPNYTTAGHIVRDEVIEATNRFCGGVALTYHAFKGPEWFKEMYETWRSLLAPHVQLNVHVIADVDVANNLLDLALVGLRDLNIVLLAYYPDIGRAGYDRLMPKGVYQIALPEALAEVDKKGFKIAFSEGLLPYFLTMKIPTVDPRFATRQEGLFSCYVDDKGFVSHSSFDPAEPPTKHEWGDLDWMEDGEREKFKADREAQWQADYDNSSIFNRSFQDIWNEGFGWNVGRDPGNDECWVCPHIDSCSAPDETHYLQCARAHHNSVKAKVRPKRVMPKLKVIHNG